MLKLEALHYETCYIGLGSNRGDPPKLLAKALAALVDVEGVQLVSTSSVYKTEPQGDTAQPWFYNQVAEIRCTLTPYELLAELQRIENALGRLRTQRRFGPRHIDLDILLYGFMVINDEKLSIPHPRMRERAFVLVPLVELAPDLTLPPDGAKLAAVLENVCFTLTDDKIYQTL